jgi:hypothetical protein
MSGIAKSSIIEGKLSLLVIQEISCEGFNGLQTYAIAKTKIEEKGFFYGVYDGVKIKKVITLFALL